MRGRVSLPDWLKSFEGKMQLSGGESLKRDSRGRKGEAEQTAKKKVEEKVVRGAEREEEKWKKENKQLCSWRMERQICKETIMNLSKIMAVRKIKYWRWWTHKWRRQRKNCRKWKTFVWFSISRKHSKWKKKHTHTHNMTFREVNLFLFYGHFLYYCRNLSRIRLLANSLCEEMRDDLPLAVIWWLFS